MKKINVDLDSLKKTIDVLNSEIKELKKLKKCDDNIYYFDIQRLEEKIEKLIEIKLKIIQAIEQLDNVYERAVLRYRYICNLKWKEIEQKTGYSHRSVFRFERRAKKKINKILKKFDFRL